jgi:hypothetical protein
VPALAIETAALIFDRWTQTLAAPRRVNSGEWSRAMAWAILPAALLLGTALAMTA